MANCVRNAVFLKGMSIDECTYDRTENQPVLQSSRCPLKGAKHRWSSIEGIASNFDGGQHREGDLKTTDRPFTSQKSAMRVPR